MPRGNSESLYFMQQNLVCINKAEHCISSIWGTMQEEKKKCFNMHFKMTAQWMDQRTDDF